MNQVPESIKMEVPGPGEMTGPTTGLRQAGLVRKNFGESSSIMACTSQRVLAGAPSQTAHGVALEFYFYPLFLGLVYFLGDNQNLFWQTCLPLSFVMLSFTQKYKHLFSCIGSTHKHVYFHFTLISLTCAV